MLLSVLVSGFLKRAAPSRTECVCVCVCVRVSSGCFDLRFRRSLMACAACVPFSWACAVYAYYT
eukprot:8939427-Alexandrium_andersonii.AAC.1